MPIAASATKYARIHPARIRSSTKNGSNHNANCGECTLLNSRYPQIIAAQTGSHGYERPRPNRRKPSAQASSRAASVVTVAAIARSCWTAALFESLYGLAPQNQMVLGVRSIGRLHWNWNDAHQPVNPAIMNGRLIARNTAPVPTAKAAATSHRDRAGWDEPARDEPESEEPARDEPECEEPALPRHRPVPCHPPVPSQRAIGNANIIGYSLKAPP